MIWANVQESAAGKRYAGIIIIIVVVVSVSTITTTTITICLRRSSKYMQK